MNLSLQEKLRFQKQAGIITLSEYNRLMEEDETNDMIQVFKQSIHSIKQDAKTIEPQEEELQEGLALTFGAIASAPGILEALGDATNYIVKYIKNDPSAETKFGNTLKKWGHKLHDAYVSGLASLLQAAFPDKYRNQNWDDKNSLLYKHAHGLYLTILSACAIAGVSSLADVHSLSTLAGEGGLLGIKASEIKAMAQKIV
jgi:hypothetical protein